MDRQTAFKAIAKVMNYVWAYGRNKECRRVAEGWDTGLVWIDTDEQRQAYIERHNMRAGELVKPGSPALAL